MRNCLNDFFARISSKRKERESVDKRGKKGYNF